MFERVTLRNEPTNRSKILKKITLLFCTRNNEIIPAVAVRPPAPQSPLAPIASSWSPQPPSSWSLSWWFLSWQGPLPRNKRGTCTSEEASPLLCSRFCPRSTVRPSGFLPPPSGNTCRSSRGTRGLKENHKNHIKYAIEPLW